MDKITGITVTVGGTKTKTVSLTQDIIGRHLPANFVIAGKRNGLWYALPSTMTETTHPEPVLIAVDNETTPTIAYTIIDNAYSLYNQTATIQMGGNGQYVKLAMKGLNDAPLFGMASPNTEIGKSGTAVVTHDLSSGYWWQLKQTNTTISSAADAIYEVYCANNTSSLSIKNDPVQWGLYASGVQDLRLLKLEEITPIDAKVTEWGKNSAVFDVYPKVDETLANKVIAYLGASNSDAKDVTETTTSVKGTSSKYNYTINFGDGIDFSAAASEGAILRLEWKNDAAVLGSSVIIVPKIIAANANLHDIDAYKTHWKSKDVHVLPGNTLTVDAGSFENDSVTIGTLEIYPGATVKVTTGALTATNLILRNGWTRAGSKSYDVARLYVTPLAATLKATNVYADWYIDYDQYYPIAVPWNATIASISYRNTNSAATVGSSVRLRYYDGASRASNVQSGVGEGANWKEYGATGNLSTPATLTPGIGYAMTAKRPTGKAFSIIRMPLTLPSGTWSEGTWTTNGESGSVNTTHKDQVSVTAHGDDNTPAYAKGWNFIANPYMSLYGGTIEYSDATKVNFVNIPDVDFKEFGQYATAVTNLKPASGFLIQAPKDGTLTFGSSNRAAAAPSYHNATKEVAMEQQAYILLANDAAEDMMGILVSEKYTADYELNADLEKLLSDGNTLRTYMRYNDMNMAYLAINEELAKQLIPVSVRIPADGEYTFRIHEASIADELEGIYLTDYQTNTVTNLLYDSYTFNAVAGTDNVRFAINAVIGKREVPTGVDISGSDKDRPTKFIWNDKVYILHNNVIYDSTGKRVNVINK